MAIRRYLVTANNISIELRLHSAPVTVTRDGEGFVAEHSLFGVSEPSPDRLSAIRNLLHKRGCYDIHINSQVAND